MPKKNRKVGSVKKQLLSQARESALCAIKIFNDPLIEFKSETFIVLMVIAWTYLMHAYYRYKGIDYCYFDKPNKRKIYHKTKDGSKKHWELETCLNQGSCPLDPITQKNLRFLIGLRHEIEHHMATPLDDYLSARYQACALNFNEYIKKLFGLEFGMDSYLFYAIQFGKLDEKQLDKNLIPRGLVKYIDSFDNTLTIDEYNNPHFAYRLLFVNKIASRPGQADKIIEFIPVGSELAKNIDKQYWVIKDRERPKYRPTHIVKMVRNAGYTGFTVSEHAKMWQAEKAKDPAKGFGVDVEGQWYWYENWVSRCIQLCQSAGDKYRK